MEIWFYQLERSSRDVVLAELLEKTLARGWRALVRAGDTRVLDEVDDRLWSERPESFLAHGRDGAGEEARQPILLSETGENRNGAQALFILDGVELGPTPGIERCFILFNGRDEQALATARDRWRTLKGEGADIAYWRQTDEGGWVRAA